MTSKTKTVVVIESHAQTVIRRSRRTVSGELMMEEAVARPDAPEPAVLEKPKGRWWLIVALKAGNVFTHWSRRPSAAETNGVPNNHEDSRSCSPSGRKRRR